MGGKLLRGLQPYDIGKGSKTLVETLSEGPLPQVLCGTGGGFPGDPLAGSEWGGTRVTEREPSPFPPGRSLDVYSLLPFSSTIHESERPPGPLHAPPRAGHNSGTGGWKQPPFALPKILYACPW